MPLAGGSQRDAGCHPAQLPRRNRLIAGGKEESLLGEDCCRGLNRRRGLVVLVALVVLDPRDSDTTRCRGFSALTPRAHNEEDGRETILFLNAYFLYFAIASYDRFTCAFVFV